MAKIRILQTQPVEAIEDLLIRAIDESTTLADLRTKIKQKMRARLDAMKANQDQFEPGK